MIPPVPGLSARVMRPQQPRVTASRRLLQRKCDCGNHTIAGDDCEECKAKKRSGLQAKLQIDTPGDVYEQEADRIAEQVVATSPVSAVADVSFRIQRVTGQWSPSAESAPPSVERTLATAGQPLEPALRNDMEQRFGHDFSGVRVHSGALAEQSARDVQAHAYTAGTSVVFGAGRYAPQTRAGRRLLAHELTHVVQQSGAEGNRGLSRIAVPNVVARTPDRVRQATDEDRRELVDAAARWLVAMAGQVESLRRMAAVALASTQGSAAAPRAFHRHMNEEVLGRLLTKAISVFEAQRSANSQINFPTESPEQTRLGEAYARAMHQFGLAIEEARGNAAGLAPLVRDTEERAYALNHLRWLEANPAAPLAAGVRTTFTQTEVSLSARHHQQVAAELANLTATVHRYDLAGDGAQRLRGALLNAVYRLVRDPSGGTDVQRDATLEASIRPVLDTLSGIEWAIARAVDRLVRAEARTRDFIADATANKAVGDTLQAHFATRDPGYAALLADRLARMARELRGEGSLTIHARDPQDPHCGVGSVGGGLSVTAAHAEANRFRFCSDVHVGDDERVSTVVHETVHAVIPSLGALSPVTTSTKTPDDRAYAFERIYSRLSTEEALANAESYSFYVDSLLGIRVQRPSAPQDSVTGCADSDPVHDAIARATYRIRLAAMWAGQTFEGGSGTTPPPHVIDVIRAGFPGVDAVRAQAIRSHLRHLAGSLDYFLPVVCRPATDREARARALVYGPSSAATSDGVAATQATYPAGTLRICPAWFQASAAVREDALTSILVLRYRPSVPVADVQGIVTVARFVQEQAHSSVVGRTLEQHRAADVSLNPTP
jgi:Domain of unknown function (DUF4157)